VRTITAPAKEVVARVKRGHQVDLVPEKGRRSGKKNVIRRHRGVFFAHQEKVLGIEDQWELNRERRRRKGGDQP